QVLDMLGEQQRSALEHQDSTLMAAVGIEEVRSQGGAARATTDDDHVEGARVTLGAAVRAAAVRISAPEGLVEAVANKAAEHIAGEVGDFGGGSGHGMSLFLSVRTPGCGQFRCFSCRRTQSRANPRRE